MVDDRSNFITSGGDSLKALQFVEDLESQLVKFNEGIQTNMVLDLLLNKTFAEMHEYLVNKLTNSFSDIDQNSELTFKSKRTKLASDVQTTTTTTIPSSELMCWLSKTGQWINQKYSISTQIKSEQSSKFDLQLRWKVDMLKCIDATPLIVKFENQPERVLIGSHSKQFVCVDGQTGSVIWSIEVADRIESSACVSKCANFVIFGNIFSKNPKLKRFSKS